MKPIEIAKWSATVLDEGAALVVIVGCNWLLWDGTRFECEYRYDYDELPSDFSPLLDALRRAQSDLKEALFK